MPERQPTYNSGNLSFPVVRAVPPVDVVLRHDEYIDLASDFGANERVAEQSWKLLKTQAALNQKLEGRRPEKPIARPDFVAVPQTLEGKYGTVLPVEFKHMPQITPDTRITDELLKEADLLDVASVRQRVAQIKHYTPLIQQKRVHEIAGSKTSPNIVQIWDWVANGITPRRPDVKKS